MCLLALHAYVLTCLRALHAYMLTCLCVLHAYVLTCLVCLGAYVPCLLTCLRANVLCMLMCSRKNVSSSVTLIHINLYSNQKTQFQLLIDVLLFFKFESGSSFINNSNLLFCILIFNTSVLKIKQFSLDLYNQQLTNEEVGSIEQMLM